MGSMHRNIPAGTPSGASRLTAADVRGIVGRIRDDKLAAILATGATAAQVTEAFAWLTGDEHFGRELQRPLSGVVAAVYEILKPDWPEADEEYPPAS